MGFKFPRPIRHRCRICPRSLGRYSISPVDLTSTAVMPRDRGLTEHDHHSLGPGPERGDKVGERTGTGLYPESFGGRDYVRIRCKCGRDEKLSTAKYTALPVRQERGEPVVYL